MITRIAMLSALTLDFCLPRVSHAYEVDTHAAITQRAYERSVLASAELRERLGWNRYIDLKPFAAPAALASFSEEDNGYWDIPAPQWTAPDWPNAIDRKQRFYERANFPGLFRGSGDEPQRNELQIQAWLMRGAVREDDLLIETYLRQEEHPPDADPYGEINRVYHHFYDPVNDRELRPEGIACSTFGGVLPGSLPDRSCRPALDWALGAVDVANNANAAPDPARRNHFTWADAREAMWCGLTYRGSPISRRYDAAVRRLCWATQVKALGHTLHLLQDMAQPQHTRNDRHNPPGGDIYDVFATNMARRTFETFVNWRQVAPPAGSNDQEPATEEAEFQSLFESYLREWDLVRLPPVYEGYPTPRFSEAVDYFTTRHRGEAVAQRRGLADFSNRNLFTEGTQFSVDFPLPPANPSSAAYEVLSTPPRLLADRGFIGERIYSVAPIDSVNPGFADPALASSDGRIPVAAEGLWSAYGGEQLSRLAPIPLELYATHADLLLPRAVAYSAGLIDYFYRGKLSVSPPADGPYAALDHGTPHFVDVQGYPRRQDNNAVFGFTRLRLRVANLTPAIAPSGGGAGVRQVAAGGRLLAVARYHRNPCYQSNLDGEWTRVFPGDIAQVPAAGACASRDALRTGYEEVSVSAPINVRGDIDQQNPLAAAFDFSADPIPINVTDLRVQVVYRGVLGEEADGIAVGHADLPEPFYVAFLNNSDYYNEYGAWVRGTPNGLFPPEEVGNLELIMGVAGGSGVRVIDSVGVLRPARFARVAVLDQPAPYAAYLALRFVADQIGVGRTFDIASAPVRQATREEVGLGGYQPMPTIRERGVSYHVLGGLHRREGDLSAPPLYELPPMSPRTADPNVLSVVQGLIRADEAGTAQPVQLVAPTTLNHAEYGGGQGH